MATSAYTTLWFNEGKQYRDQVIFSARTIYGIPYITDSVAGGGLTASDTLSTITLLSGTGVAAASAVLGATDGNGDQSVPSIAFGPSVADWASWAFGILWMSAASSGKALFAQDHSYSCVKASSTTVTTASTANLVAGMKVQGVGIPSSTTISSITNATTFVLSQAATDSATNRLAFGIDLSNPGSYFTVPAVTSFTANPWEV